MGEIALKDLIIGMGSVINVEGFETKTPQTLDWVMVEEGAM